MKTISERAVNQTWARLAETPAEQAEVVFERLSKHQPYVLAYLLSLEEELEPDERGKYLFIGLAILEILTAAAGRSLPEVSGDALDAAEAANVAHLEQLEEGSETDCLDSVQRLIQTYNQMPLLGAVLEALMEEHQDEPELAGNEVGLALLRFKTIIDCFDQ